MEHNVAIVHYNTPALTSALVRSIRKHSPGCSVTVFDNSDRLPFPPTKGVRVIDNTMGQVIDFDEMLDRYPKKIPPACNWGSEKHIASVDRLFDVFPDGFVLLDSDVLLKRDITPFFDPSVAWVGAVEYKPKFWFQAVRCYPFILWLNVPMLRKAGIRFFHPGKVYEMGHQGPPYYDTGGSLYEDCGNAGLPVRETDIYDYIEHFGGASCASVPAAERASLWLKEHRNLYE